MYQQAEGEAVRWEELLLDLAVGGSLVTLSLSVEWVRLEPNYGVLEE